MLALNREPPHGTVSTCTYADPLYLCLTCRVRSPLYPTLV